MKSIKSKITIYWNDYIAKTYYFDVDHQLGHLDWDNPIITINQKIDKSIFDLLILDLLNEKS